MSPEDVIAAYGLGAIFGIMLFKEAGVPVPIPGDLIMFGVATQAAQGRVGVFEFFVAILVPMLVGGTLQYVLARGPARAAIYRYGRRIGLTEARLNAVMERVRKGGTAAVAIGLSTPGLRIPTTPASGLASLPAPAFFPGLAIGSTIFLGWHYALGLAGGTLLDLWKPSPLEIGILLAAILGLGIAAAVVSYRRRRARGEAVALPAAAAEWAHASCPVCAASTLLRREEPEPAAA